VLVFFKEFEGSVHFFLLSNLFFKKKIVVVFTYDLNLFIDGLKKYFNFTT
jgi:hypothetical protein